jgi:NitT/TauT family transport system permease protein
MSADTLARPVPADLPAPAEEARTPLRRRIWRQTWPKLLAVGLFVALWQAVVATGWRPQYVLPAPATVLEDLLEQFSRPDFWSAVGTTLQRGITGFLAAIVLGTTLGVAVARFRVLRAGVGSLVTGLQTMPSIVWFPLAILLFGFTEQAIFFVVVLGAFPSIANGIVSGIDHVPPAFTRLGTVLGAGSVQLYRHVVLPAALPSYVQGLNQGWAFAWRSLMAGELLVIIEGRPSLGGRLMFALEFGDAVRLIAYMLVILALGMLADSVFSSAAQRMRARRGLKAD